MALTLTVGGNNQLPYILAGSMSLKRNTLDCGLNNPANKPVIGDNVTMADPTWVGTVKSVTTTDATDKQGAKYVMVTFSATNADEAEASAAPFGLSDTPNNSTTYGYSNLSVQTFQEDNGTQKTNGSCITWTEGLWPGMTFELTSSNHGYSAADFTVTDVTVSWPTADHPVYSIAFGDAIVTMSVWMNENAADYILPIDETKITDGAVTTPKIATNAITADKIEAHSITADKLEADLILSSRIKTAETGSRVEIDTNGIRNYSSDGTLQVNVPTDGGAVSVTGQIEASTLVSNTSAELHGTNTLSKGSVTTLEYSVTDPSAPPTVVSWLASLTLTTTPSHVGHGICYDSAGGAGGATATYWIGADPTATGSIDVAYEYDASTGELLRTIQKTGTTTTTTTTLGSTGHVSDTSQAYSGANNSQVATPLTMPRDGTITRVSAYLAGYGGDASCRNAIWDTSGNSLRESSTYTASSRTFSNGNDVKYDKALSSGYFLASGTSFWAGFLHTSSADGFFYSRDDGSSKTTKRGDGLTGDMTGIETDSASKPNVYVTYTYEVDGSLEGAMTKIIGVARITGQDILWVLDSSGILYRYVRSSGVYDGKIDLSAYIGGTEANAGLFYDGTNLIITTATGTTGTDQVRFVKVNASSGAYVSTHNTTGLAINGSTATIRGGYLDSGYFHVSVSGTVRIYSSSTYAYYDNTEFGVSAETTSGVTYDGSVARGYASAYNPTKIWSYTTWTWTTESSVYWFGYTWYDSAGTTHETALSPRSSLTLGRRRKVTITTPAIPVSGADDPNNVRVYVARNATEPAAGNYKLQATHTGTSITATGFNASGAADPTSNDFASGTAAELKSSATGWVLKGDGIANIRGMVALTFVLPTPLSGSATVQLRCSDGDSAITSFRIPFDAQVIGVSVTLASDRTAGTLTAQCHNASSDTLVGPVCTIDGTTTNYGEAREAYVGDVDLTIDNAVGMKITTTGFTPTTNAIVGVLWLMAAPGGLS